MFHGQPMNDVAIDSCCSTTLIRPLATLTSNEVLEEMPSSISTIASEAVRCYRSKTFDTLTFRGIDGTEKTFRVRTKYVPGNVPDLLIGMALIT